MNVNETIVVQLVGSLGATGVLAWYCWYVTSTTLPRLVDAFREELTSIRQESAAERDRRWKQIEHMTEESAAERDRRWQQIERIADVIKSVSDKCQEHWTASGGDCDGNQA
jgi:hypothetical protein